MLFIATMSHFLSDFLGTMFKPLGPYFIERFGIDSATFGSTMALISSVAALMQIGFGLFYDNVKRDGLHILILLIGIIGLVGVVGFSNSFSMLIVFVFLITLLNSAYHPIGASLAGSRHRGKDIALFSVFGTLGSAAGPVVITTYTSTIGFDKLYFLSIGIFILLLPFIPRVVRHEKETVVKKKFPGFSALKMILPLFIVVAFRSFIMDTFHTYVPIFLNEKGASLITGGTVITIGLLAGMCTTYIGVMLREKIGIFKINLIGFLIMGIMGLLFFYVPDNFIRAVCFLLFDAGGFLTMSANIVEAQSRMPSNKAFASSVTMGFAWSTGGFIGAGYAAAFGNNLSFLLLSISAFSIVLSVLMIFFSYRYGRKKKA
ncbi:MAG TPA: MFS transporter [Thermotogota bacterium]|nr:MFS transporter [Thermotogota bacterium]HPJ87842.1 MFS transporter [Thermotogota bacterium]HPR96326.1 MFS transporter [Thermotogota bacterium]